MGPRPAKDSRRVFVSWVPHTTRSASLSRALGAECVFVPPARMRGLRMVLCMLRTLAILASRRPAVVFCMNPPYFNPLTGWAYARFARARVVIDSHTAAFDDPRPRWLAPLHGFVVRRAVCSLVTNAALAARVTAMGGRAVVISDIPDALPDGRYPVPAEGFSIVYVSNYAPDEPLAEVLAAAAELSDVRFFITGDDRKADPNVMRARPANVTPTGYLSRESYAGLLRGVSAVLVLTTREHTMQRGGSEAISAGKPLITSDTQTLRAIFTAGTVHVAPRAPAIRAGIQELRRNYDAYARGIRDLATRREERWLRAREELEALLSGRRESARGARGSRPRRGPDDGP